MIIKPSRMVYVCLYDNDAFSGDILSDNVRLVEIFSCQLMQRIFCQFMAQWLDIFNIYCNCHAM